MLNAEDYEVVVIDAANVVHHHAYDDDENLIQSIFPERLQSCVEFFQESGWDVRAFLKQGTYWWAVKNKEMDTIGDVKIFETLRRQGVLEIVSSEHDDMFWIDYAIKHNGLVITRDKLKTEKEEYERDWDAIEHRILRDWDVLETGEFLAPSVPVKEEADRISFKTLRTRLSELEKRVAELELARESATTEVKQTKPADGDVENDETIVAITNEVFRRLLEPGEYVHLTHIYHTLASVHLQLQPGKFQTWPADWKEQLTGMLKVSGKMSVWVKDICPVPIEFSTEDRSLVKKA